MHAIWTDDEDAQQDAAQQIIQIAKPCTIWRWSESTLPNGKPLLRTPNDNAHLLDLQWTEDEQAKLKPLRERYTPRGASGTWRVHRSWLGCLSLVLGDTKDYHDVSGQCYDQCPLNT